MKKLLPLLLFPLLLTSCGDSVYGEYSFMMGKPDDDARFGITLELLKMKVEDEGEVIGKRLLLDFDLKKEMLPPQPDVKEDPLGYVLYGLLYDIIDNGVNGYYWFNGNYEDKGTLVNIGIITDIFKVKDEVIQKIFFAYLDNQSTMNFVMPCSIVDLQMQLCWYGIYINDVEHEEGKIPVIDVKELDEEKLPKTSREDRIGTHPTKEDVSKMNEAFAEEFAEAEFSFRDYHTLTIPLKKEK